MEVQACIKRRKSIRQFKEEQVPREAVVKCLEAAIEAPSPKHQQNWYFAVIESKEKIQKLAEIVEKSHEKIASLCKDEKERQYFMKFMKYYTLFKAAPTVVLVYSKPYDMIEEKILRESGASEEFMNVLKAPQSGAQGIGAAVENFLLTATDLGYGTCYMTGPTHAKIEIEALMQQDIPEHYELMSMIAMGVPEEKTYRKPERRPLEEVVCFID